jgi:hypothetical protein
VNLDLLARGNGRADALHRAVHIPQQKRIVQVFDPGVEEMGGTRRIAKSALKQDLGRRDREVQFRGDFGEPATVGGGRENPAANCWNRNRRARRLRRPDCRLSAVQS